MPAMRIASGIAAEMSQRGLRGGRKSYIGTLTWESHARDAHGTARDGAHPRGVHPQPTREVERGQFLLRRHEFPGRGDARPVRSANPGMAGLDPDRAESDLGAGLRA